MTKTKKDNTRTIEIKRLPRNMGTTYAMAQYHNPITTQTKKQDILNRLKATILNNWITGQGYLNNTLITMDNICSYLNITAIEVMRQMNRQWQVMGDMLQGEKAQQFARANFFGTWQKILETHSLTAHQASVLMASQGAEYKAFISPAVNQALANMNMTTKTQLEALKMIMGTQLGPQGSLPSVPGNTTNNTYITTDMAVKAIKEHSQSLMENEAALDTKLITLKANDPEIPEVSALHQDLTTIGLKYDGSGAQDKPIVPSKVGQRRQNRRARSLGVQDIDDAELKDFRQ